LTITGISNLEKSLCILFVKVIMNYSAWKIFLPLGINSGGERPGRKM